MVQNYLKFCYFQKQILNNTHYASTARTLKYIYTKTYLLCGIFFFKYTTNSEVLAIKNCSTLIRKTLMLAKRSKGNPHTIYSV